MNEQTEIRIDELVYKSLEGIITEQECRELETMLSSDPDAPEYYVSSIEFNNRILKIKDSIHKPLQMMMAFEEMAEYEKIAPAIDAPGEKQQRELVQKVVYPPREGRKVSKFSIFMLVNSAAAILLFVLFLRFTPPESGVEAAILVDSLHAKWVDVDSEMVNGAAVPTGGRSLLLREGYAELRFNNQARVTIEGPAEFQIITEDQIKLVYGRLYARVPREAIGFTVKTPSAQIVDLGTEFGVDCSLHSDTSLHVIKGKTVLIAGDKTNKKTVEVAGGDAKKVSAQSQKVSDIPCDDRLFVRKIDSSSNLVWRGQTELSLADIVGGGNGFGKIHSLIGLDPGTGRYSPIDWQRRSVKHNYSLVPDSKFIDGVFVPDGGSEGSIVISSAQDIFQCPDTTGEYTYGIAVYTGDVKKLHDSIPQATFDGHPYLNDEIVMIHSNAGITFDLEAIRQSLPGLALTHFKAFGGITEALRNTKTGLPEADFWLVVDGQIRYEKKALTIEDGKVSFDVELGPRDRFLTLIVADGYRITEAPGGRPLWNNDYFYLVDPKLYIESASD